MRDFVVVINCTMHYKDKDQKVPVEADGFSDTIDLHGLKPLELDLCSECVDKVNLINLREVLLNYGIKPDAEPKKKPGRPRKVDSAEQPVPGAIDITPAGNPLIPCGYCGEPKALGTGMTRHMKRVHPEYFEAYAKTLSSKANQTRVRREGRRAS